MSCFWWWRVGRFMMGLDGWTPLEFFNAASGYTSKKGGFPTIYLGSGQIYIVGRDRKNKPFTKKCKNIGEAKKEWKAKFNMSKVPKLTKPKLIKLKKAFAHFATGPLHDLPTIFAANGKVFIMCKNRNDNHFEAACKNISEAVRIWKKKVKSR